MKVVLCNGCFDILHIGHIQHLREAREMGDKLVLALTADDGVRRKGPDRPFNTWSDRALVLMELRCVDSVIWSDSAVQSIRDVKPAYFVKGIDYMDGNHFTENVIDACAEVGAELKFTSAPKRSVAEIIKKAAA